ncbi:MAG TPA: GatB/YqeY domain-containing protein [Longimicrobiales bacterium]|nr:GatB/YqeY domain-containing protein [Longimicrobiales bacterium]
MTDTLKGRLREDLNGARRERDKLRTMVLTTTLSELKNREIELGREAEETDVVDVVNRAVKRRREAAEQMRAGGREELALKEEQEAVLLMAYLPRGLTEAEVRALARAAVADGADSVGAVMSRLMPAIKGRFDGREANRIAREELGA